MVSLQDRTLVLIDKAKQGDEKSFTELFNVYKPRVYYYISRISKNKTDSEDLTMEVLEKVFDNLNSYKPTHNFTTWINKVSKNYTLDYIKRRNIQVIDIEQDFINNDNPEINLINNEQFNILERCINRLRTNYRSVLDLYCLENLSYREISKRLNVTELNCRSYLFRARKKLRYEYNGTN